MTICAAPQHPLHDVKPSAREHCVFEHTHPTVPGVSFENSYGVQVKKWVFQPLGMDGGLSFTLSREELSTFICETGKLYIPPEYGACVNRVIKPRFPRTTDALLRFTGGQPVINKARSCLAFYGATCAALNCPFTCTIKIRNQGEVNVIFGQGGTGVSQCVHPYGVNFGRCAGADRWVAHTRNHDTQHHNAHTQHHTCN